jgi:hypothetical protein
LKPIFLIFLNFSFSPSVLVPENRWQKEEGRNQKIKRKRSKEARLDPADNHAFLAHL